MNKTYFEYFKNIEMHFTNSELQEIVLSFEPPSKEYNKLLKQNYYMLVCDPNKLGDGEYTSARKGICNTIDLLDSHVNISYNILAGMAALSQVQKKSLKKLYNKKYNSEKCVVFRAVLSIYRMNDSEKGSADTLDFLVKNSKEYTSKLQKLHKMFNDIMIFKAEYDAFCVNRTFAEPDNGNPVFEEVAECIKKFEEGKFEAALGKKSLLEKYNHSDEEGMKIRGSINTSF